MRTDTGLSGNQLPPNKSIPESQRIGSAADINFVEFDDVAQEPYLAGIFFEGAAGQPACHGNCQ